PTIHLESPTPHTTLRGDHLLRGTTQGPRNITHVELQLRRDNYAYSGSRDPWRQTTGTTDWHTLLDTRAFPDGDYDLVIRATDDAHGTGLTHTPITIQNGPTPNQITIQLADPPTHIDTDTTLRASAFHPEGVTHIRYRIDHDDWTTETENPLAFTIDIHPNTLTPGPHTLEIQAYHGITETTNTTHTFTIPGQTPTLIIDEPPNQVAHALIRATGRIHHEGRAQYRIDQTLWQNLPPGPTWNLSTDTLPYHGGNHTLQLRAISPDGRLTSEPKTYRIEIINPPFTHSDQTQPNEHADHDVPAPTIPTLLAALTLLAAARRKMT
ncbi:MAG TPA: hypothetical protein VM370_08655, partial [Candidatus Thermoplasmatota archaeon]|nr:hypothetical protein [Candidatus Thermoplasmatota archaeon]